MVLAHLPAAMSSRPGGSRRATVLLVLGAAAGILAAAAGLVGGAGGRSLPPDAVARVNGQLIGAEEYQRVLAGLASDRRDGVDAEARRQVLDRLIDEELLVERGLELGLARRDARVRKDLTAAVIDSVVAESADREPSETELEAFSAERPDVLRRLGRLRVRQIWCRAATAADEPAALARARRAADRLRHGDAFAAVRDAAGDPELAPLPDALLPPAKLLDYLGPTALRAALALEPGAVSDPVRSRTGYHVLQVVERREDADVPLDEARPEVVAEFRRRSGERALRTYLEQLRRRGQIEVAASLP